MISDKRIAKNISYFKYRTSFKDDIVSNKLIVAQFQRNYVWARNHIKDLIKSINEHETGYYIGNIIIKRCKAGSNGSDFIVDGQQRLTTLSLITKAINDEFDIRDKEKIQKILFFKDRNPFISFSRKNLNVAYKKILLGGIIEKRDESQMQFFKNYEFIKKELKKIEDKAEFFYKILNLEFVVIKCPGEHNVHQLFESLNSKGKKLSPVQLTKNSLLAFVETKESDFKKINSSWNRIESNFEKTKNIWFDKFFRHQWFSVGGYISENALFEKTKNKINEMGPIKYTLILENDSKIYLSLRNGNASEINFRHLAASSSYRKSDLLIANIKELRSDQIYAVLLALVKYGNKNNNYFKDEFAKDLEKLWCYSILLRYSKKISPSSYEKHFADFCFNLNNPEGKKIKSIRKDFFDIISKKIPNEQDFIEIINSKIFYSGNNDDNICFDNNRDIVRSILTYYLTNGDNIIPVESETAEHIIPKGGLSNWKNILPENLEDVKNYRFKLGNLTMLKKTDNEKIENFNFDKKLLVYKKCKYIENRKLLHYQSKFNSNNPCEVIEERGKIIGKKIYEICLNKLKK